MMRGRGLLWMLTALVMGLALSGCGGGGGTVEGDWVLDTDATRSNVKPFIEKQLREQFGDSDAMKKAGKAVDTMVTQAVDNMMKALEVTISFKGDGTCTLTGKFGDEVNVAKGSWTQDGSTITLKVTGDNDKEEEFVVRTKGGKLLMDLGQQDKDAPQIDLVLKRK